MIGCYRIGKLCSASKWAAITDLAAEISVANFGYFQKIAKIALKVAKTALKIAKIALKIAKIAWNSQEQKIAWF